jgi:hypothetical protein
MLMSADPETSLALAAAVQRVASWTGAGMPPGPAAVVTIARRLEISAHAEVEGAADMDAIAEVHRSSPADRPDSGQRPRS